MEERHTHTQYEMHNGIEKLESRVERGTMKCQLLTRWSTGWSDTVKLSHAKELPPQSQDW